jgi:hypothetical protein
MLYMKKATGRKPHGRSSGHSKKRLIGGLPDFQTRTKKIFGNKKFTVSGGELLTKEKEEWF